MNADDQRSEKDRFKHVSYPRSSASIRGQILLLVPLAHNAGSLRRRLKGSNNCCSSLSATGFSCTTT